MQSTRHASASTRHATASIRHATASTRHVHEPLACAMACAAEHLPQCLPQAQHLPSKSTCQPTSVCSSVCPSVCVSVAKLHRFYTRCFVVVPKSKRKALADKGLHNLRAEPGRFIGFQCLISSTYAAVLDVDRDRLVHSINVTFDDTDYTSNPGPDIRPVIHELAASGCAVRGGEIWRSRLPRS